MYKENCNKSLLGLTCPSKSTPPSTSATTSTVFTSTPPSTSATTYTVSTSTPPSTSATTYTVSTNGSSNAGENSKQVEKEFERLKVSEKVIFWFLGVTLLLNSILFFLFLHEKNLNRQKKQKRGTSDIDGSSLIQETEV
ncbi:uncharacterized protein [Misgurnus anguillicaudatus]|uniref:uncharacterized protein isoform X1 n=1 Tax=Misgurnus anguillicaudatus TaxID=75329 RepID=UPI003CCF2EC9